MERLSLPAQAAEAILAKIRAAQWKNWLPGERQLSRLLQVSRGTVRSALTMLQQQKHVTVVASRGYRVTQRRSGRNPAKQRILINLVSSEPIEIKRPYFALMVGHIRESAQARGWNVALHNGGHLFGARAAIHLQHLVQSSPASCWILIHSTHRAQKWFVDAGLPALVSGHTYDGINLPGLDVDLWASGHHAAIQLARMGHTRVVTVVSKHRLPGLIEGDAGFAEGFGSATKNRGVILQLPYNGDDTALARNLMRMMKQSVRPTSILTETPNQYLTVMSALAQLRLVVPDDVSVVSRLDDSFLEHLVPEPARYHISPVVFARSLVRMVAHLALGENLPHTHRLLMPDFIRGGSLGPAAHG